jgi:hypothetical protein
MNAYVIAKDGAEEPRVILDLAGSEAVQLAFQGVKACLGAKVAMHVANSLGAAERQTPVARGVLDSFKEATFPDSSREADMAKKTLVLCGEIFLQVAVARDALLDRLIEKETPPPISPP